MVHEQGGAGTGSFVPLPAGEGGRVHAKVRRKTFRIWGPASPEGHTAHWGSGLDWRAPCRPVPKNGRNTAVPYRSGCDPIGRRIFKAREYLIISITQPFQVCKRRVRRTRLTRAEHRPPSQAAPLMAERQWASSPIGWARGWWNKPVSESSHPYDCTAKDGIPERQVRVFALERAP
jgi:hypothetical protein